MRTYPIRERLATEVGHAEYTASIFRQHDELDLVQVRDLSVPRKLDIKEGIVPPCVGSSAGRYRRSELPAAGASPLLAAAPRACWGQLLH